MDEYARSLVWEAPEHRHIEKTSDWYWALGIIAIAASAASMLFNNVLFGMVILLGAATMILHGHKAPRIISYELSSRGIRIGDKLHLYTDLEAYAIDEEVPWGPQLIMRSKHLFTPLLIIPIPEEDIDDIDLLLSGKLPEEALSEPLSHRLLEFFGF